MQKTYAFDPKTASEDRKSPKKEVLDTILAFSRSLEVLKTNVPKDRKGTNRNVEIVLN